MTEQAEQMFREALDRLAAGRSRIRAADELGKAGRKVLEDEVAEARGKGVSWQEIADQLGMESRQAALARFGSKELPGLSENAAARAAGVARATLARDPGKYGFELVMTGDRRRYRPAGSGGE